MNLKNWQWKTKWVAVAGTAVAVTALAGAGVVSAAGVPSSLPACSQSDDGTSRTVVCPDPPVPTVTQTVPGPTTTVTVTASAEPTTTPPTSVPPTSNPPTTITTPPPVLRSFPDATNTGPAAGTVFTAVPAQLTSGPGWSWNASGAYVSVTGNGADLENLAITGHIEITASNVTIKNDTVLNNAGGSSSWGIALRNAGKNNLIENDLIGATSQTSGRLLTGIKDVNGNQTNMQIIGCNIYHTATGIQSETGLIQDNYIHDMGLTNGDHVNGQTSNGGFTGLLDIEHNTIENQYNQTDAVSLFEDFGQQTNRTINDNLLSGGGYTIYGGQNSGGVTATNIRITNNHISTKFYPNGGYWGPLAAIGSGSGDVVSGNVWADGPNAGKPVS